MTTPVKPEGQEVEPVAGLLTAAHLEVAVVYEPPTIPPQAERHVPPMHWLAAFEEPLTSSLKIGFAAPMPTYPLLAILSLSALPCRHTKGPVPVPVPSTDVPFVNHMPFVTPFQLANSILVMPHPFSVSDMIP